MRQLGLSSKPGARRLLRRMAPALFVALSFGCKAAPEPSPAEASSPLPTATNESPPPAPSAEATPPAPTASAPASSTRVYPDKTKRITAKVGERFAVALPANVTIPMKWRIDPAPDAKVLGPAAEEYFEEPPKDCPDCIGYGGTRVFTFEAKGAGKASLRFALLPLSDPKGKAQKEVGIEVEVAP